MECSDKSITCSNKLCYSYNEDRYHVARKMAPHAVVNEGTRIVCRATDFFFLLL